MICRKCAQGLATYHLSETRSDGSRFELHLCEVCAESLGITGHVASSVSDLLANLGAGPDTSGEGAHLITPMDCQKCGRGHASIHLFEAAQGCERERHLCEDCGIDASAALDAVFMDFPDAPPASVETPATCKHCGRIRFDFVKIGSQVRRHIQAAVLPMRVLVRGCAWAPP